jgi:hypothetical protein
MITDNTRIPLTRVMSVLRGLSSAEPTGGYMDLYRAILDGRLRTQQRGRQHDISYEDLPIAARIVGLNIAADIAAASVSETV